MVFENKYLGLSYPRTTPKTRSPIPRPNWTPIPTPLALVASPLVSLPSFWLLMLMLMFSLL